MLSLQAEIERLQAELEQARIAVATHERVLNEEKRRSLSPFLTTKLAILLLLSRIGLPRLPFIRRLLHQAYFGRMSFHLDRPGMNTVFNRVDGEILVSGWAERESPPGPAILRARIGRSIVVPEQTPIEGGPRYQFSARVAVPDGIHWLAVEVRIGEAGWIAIYNGLVASDARKGAFGPVEQLAQRDADERRAHVDAMLYRPTIAMLVDMSDSDGPVVPKKALGEQLYPPALVKVTATPWADLQALDAEFVVVLAAGDRPTTGLLYAFADALNADRSLDVIYGDEVRVTAKGERLPFWKPDLSPDYLESLDYIGRPVFIRRSLLVGLSIAGHYDMVLQATERTQRIGHVRSILVETRPVSDLTTTRASDIAALQGRLARTGRIGRVEPLNVSAQAYRTTLEVAERPLVSIVIPTAGQSISLDRREIDLITNCVRDIRTKSTYPHLEIIVVDNGDLTPDQVAELTGQGCRLVSFTEGEFNVAKKLNLGVAQANGEFVLLLNDDIEIISPDWIERMADHLTKPHVGVVGAKLLYTDDTIQHAGVVFYHGNPDHVRRKVPRDDEGYVYSTAVARNFIAVTGACMLTRTALYREVGGYTEALAVSYNDADFCFKVREAGFTIVYEPRAELYHFESKSRTPTLNTEELAYFQTRWAAIVSDPYYNDLELTVASPTFELCSNERLV